MKRDRRSANRSWKCLAAVKCNNDPTLLQILDKQGTGFDCASIEEMRSVLRLGIDPSRILFANPCKSPASLLFAREYGVTKTVFDNLDELDKIETYLPGAELLLRIYANDDSALISFGDKFGAHLETTPQLLVRARELGLKVNGVSFHVGKRHFPFSRSSALGIDSQSHQEPELRVRPRLYELYNMLVSLSLTLSDLAFIPQSSTSVVASRIVTSSRWRPTSLRPSNPSFHPASLSSQSLVDSSLVPHIPWSVV